MSLGSTLTMVNLYQTLSFSFTLFITQPLRHAPLLPFSNSSPPPPNFNQAVSSSQSRPKSSRSGAVGGALTAELWAQQQLHALSKEVDTLIAEAISSR